MIDRPVREQQRGFTLIELMITVAVVAILVAIAYPSYQAYTVRSNRAAAQAALMDIAQREQQYLLDQRAYATGANWQTALGNWKAPTNVANVYTIDVPAAAGPPGPPSFTATATPVAGTVQANDQRLSIDNFGNKSPVGKW